MLPDSLNIARRLKLLTHPFVIDGGLFENFYQNNAQPKKYCPDVKNTVPQSYTVNFFLVD